MTGSSLGVPREELPWPGLGFAPGQRLAGKYQLVRALDAGGMGVVWVAHHVDLDIQVALKVMRGPMEGDEHAERLLREAQTAARLDHPAIVRVLDTGRTEEGEPFLVMELLDGEPLADVLARRRRLEPTLAVRTLLPIVGALAAMHERQIIHRDIKPENIFLARDDSGGSRPKLIDFGLARAPARRITQRGVVMGTPAYLSPEQLRGEEADHHGDVWAISAVLYETITGVVPFPGATLIEIIGAALTQRIKPLADLGFADAELSAVVDRGLAPVAERWPTMRDLGRALARWLWSRGVTDDVTRVSLRSAWLDDDDVRRLPRSQVETARMPALPLPAPPAEAPATTSEPAPRAAVTVSAPPSGTSTPPVSGMSTAPVARPPAEPRRTPTWLLLLGAACVGAGAAVALTRQAPAPQIVPAASGATAIASEAPPPVVTPAGDVAATVAPSTSASAPAPAIAPKAKRPPRPAPTAGAELKNPFR
jgi:serine/threonine-protein kinase